MAHAGGDENGVRTVHPPVHITLALLARDDTVAWQVLLHVGVRPDDLRQAIEEAHGPPA